MPKEEWLEAALLCQEAREVYSKEDWREEDPTIGLSERRYSSVEHIAAALDEFFASEDWDVARVLLRSSASMIWVTECREGGGYTSVYFLDWESLKVSYEPAGMWIVYQDQNSLAPPQIKAVSSEEAARGILAASGGRATADKVVAIIREGLDSLALLIKESQPL